VRYHPAIILPFVLVLRRSIARGTPLAAVGLVALASPAAANPYNVSEVPKLIAAREAGKLHDAGIHMTDDLLRQATTPAARKQLARKTGLRGARLDQLARCADFLRLENIGPEFAMLLEAAGIKSIPDLARQSPPTLARKAETVNRTRHLAHPAPTQAQVRDWVTQAGKLPALLNPS
jgi:Domain of unknown function (DUF4332)